MKLYRVTFSTEILVECESEGDAERIGYSNLIEEVRNGASTSIYQIEKIQSVDELRRAERGSLPWRAVSAPAKPPSPNSSANTTMRVSFWKRTRKIRSSHRFTKTERSAPSRHSFFFY